MAQAPSKSQTRRVVADVNVNQEATKDDQVADGATTTTTVEEVAAETQVTEVKVTSTAAAGTYAAYAAEFLSTGNTYQRDCVNAINAYLSAMDGRRPTTEEQLAAAQKSFLSLLRNILLVSPASEFRLLWSLLLLAAKENAEYVFNDFYVFRGAPRWTGTDAELRELFALLNLIMKTRDQENRAEGLSQIKMEATHELLQSAAIERLNAFYA